MERDSCAGGELTTLSLNQQTVVVHESDNDSVWIWQEERAEEAARGAEP